MQDRTTRSAKDQLLTRILDECMEEQLSFVPPEREIARMHRFSPEFLERMQEIIRTKGREASNKYRKMEKWEFVYGFNKIAACILVLLVVGGVSLAGFTLFGPKGSSKSAMEEAVMEEAAPEEAVTEEAAEELKEEITEATQEPAEMEGGTGGQKIPDAVFLDQVVKPAEAQELPKAFGNVETVLSSSVFQPDTEELLVTVENGEEHTIYFYRYMDLNVLIDGYWYLIEPVEEPAEENLYQMVALEAGMTREEAISLGNYELDYDAELYRVVTYVDGMTICSTFRFGEEEVQ